MLRQNLFKALFILSPVIFNSTSFADERPTIPEAGEDKVLTGGKSAEQFFRERAQDTQCVAELDEAKAQRVALKKELADAIAAKESDDEIDAKEDKLNEQLEGLLDVMERCGECASRLDRLSIPGPAKTEHWYVANGSCMIPSNPKRFERMADLLLHLKAYPKKLGGFDDILEMVAVDPKTGALLPDVDKPESQPFFSFIAVRGPELIPGFPTGMNYYFRNDYVQTDSTFYYTYKAQPIPRGFKAPEIYLHRASGRKKTVRSLRLSQVLGSWYLKDGYLRYFTASDFPVDLDYAAKLARQILVSTLYQLIERTAP
jgi:hypothetical protein